MEVAYNKQKKGDDPRGMIRILLADDHPLMRKALRDVLDKCDDFEIVAEACDGEEAVSLATGLVPDVVIMDISMPKISGIEATRLLKRSLPDIAIVVLTIYSDSEHVFQILEAGADAYLTKQVYGEEVIRAIYGVANGETILVSPASKKMLKEALKNRIKPPDVSSQVNKEEAEGLLSSRDIAILRLLATGISNREIAERLHFSQLTIRNYLVQIFDKLGTSSRTEAVIKGLKSGVISLDEIA